MEPLLIREGIGERLRQERRKLAASQEQFGEMAGIKRTVVGFFERGVSVPHTDYLAAWAARGVDIIFVLFGIRAVQLAATLPESLVEGVFIRLDEFESEIGHPLDFKVRAKVFRMLLGESVSDRGSVPLSDQSTERKKKKKRESPRTRSRP